VIWRQRLRVGHIECRTDVACVQLRNERVGYYYPAARHIHQQGPRLHSLQKLQIDQTIGRDVKRHSDNYDVSVRQ
jgi:hypothetical protein